MPLKIRSKASAVQKLLRAVGSRCLRRAENNDNARIRHNGERWLLRELLRAHKLSAVDRPFVVFDVGANTGDYTRAILDEASIEACKVAIHAFEPSPVAAEKLRQSVSGTAPVRVSEVACADWTGETLLYEGGSGSSQASLIERANGFKKTNLELRVAVDRLDNYLSRGSLSHVDFIKLDVEGLEFAAMRGLGKQLRPEVVDVIQFEYGGTTRDARLCLRELHDLVVGHGYVFAKLFPASLEVRSYQEWMDNFSYANYVALSPRWISDRVDESS